MLISSIQRNIVYGLGERTKAVESAESPKAEEYNMVKKAKRKVHKMIKKAVKRSVKSIATRDASAVIKETKSVHSALKELTRDVQRIGNLEKNVAQMNKHFSSEVQNLNRKLSATEQKMTTNFNTKLGDLSSSVQKGMKSMSDSVHNKMAQQNEHFNDKMASMHSEMKIANGNASRRMDNIEEAILKMHEAVEALNDNWKDFTQSLVIEEKKR